MGVRESLDEVRASIRDGRSSDEILGKIKAVCKGIPIPMMTIKNRDLYRGRKNKEGLFSRLSEVTYPTQNAALGRLNREGTSVLYGSSSELGVVLEIRPPIHTFYSITRFRLIHPERLLFYRVDSVEYISLSEESKILATYFGELMSTSDPKEFAGTIAFGDFTMRTSIANSGFYPYPGLIYPSVQSVINSNKTTYNLAMTPATFDVNYEAISITTCMMTVSAEGYVINELNVGQFHPDGSITWQFSYAEMLNRAKSGIVNDGSTSPSLTKFFTNM